MTEKQVLSAINLGTSHNTNYQGLLDTDCLLQVFNQRERVGGEVTCVEVLVLVFPLHA